MTEPNPVSEVEEAPPANGAGSLASEGKDAVADSAKKGDEWRKDDESKGGEVTVEVEENNHNGENGTAAETGEEVKGENDAKDENAVEAEDVKMSDADDAKDVEVAGPEGTVDAQHVKEGTADGEAMETEDAKDEGVEDVKAEDVKTGTTEDVNKGDGEPEDSEDTKPADVDDGKIVNAEGAEEDAAKEDTGGKDENAEKGEEEEDGNVNEKRDSERNEKKDNLDPAGIAKKKRSRAQKATPKDPAKQKKNSAEKVIKLLGSPVTSSERPVRERKTVERLVEVISKEPNREFQVEKGRGTPLKNIPNVAYRLARKKPSDIKLIHQTLFGRKGKAIDFKSHILQFSGFVWHESDEKQRAKMKEKLDKYVKDVLLELCELFDLPVSRANSRKEDLVTKLLDFLVAPHATTDVLLAEKDKEKSRKRRRVAQGSTSSPAKGSKRKRSKSEHTPTRKGKSADDEDDEDDDDEVENDFGSSDEEKSPKHSESEIKESESEESEKEDTDDEEKPVKGKSHKKKVSKEAGSITKEKLKAGVGSKRTPISTSKSPKSVPAPGTKSKEEKNDGAKVFSRKTKNSISPKKKSTPKSDSKEKDTGKKVGKGKAKSVEVEHPTKEEMRTKICEILKEVDFNTATFTDILKRLAAHYKTDLTPRKASLKLMIQEELTRLAEEAEDNEDEDGDEDAEDE